MYMNALKLSVIAAVLGFIVGVGLLSPGIDRTGPISENISWKIDNTTVYATVTRPREAEGHLPAVLFIAGSGPTDRNWNSPMLKGSNGSGKLLAEMLAENGYVTLRYDKRTAGKHALGNILKMIGKISLTSHLAEVSGAAKVLASRADVDPSRIYVLTNSEGAVHALNYMRSDPQIPFAGMILTGAPGRTIQELGETQVQLMLTGYDNADALFASYKQAVADFLAGNDITIDPGLPKMAKTLLQSLTTPANQPFARELWTLDISPWLAEVDVPTMVLIGKKDLQVDWRLDGQPLEAQAADDPDVTFVYPENANHDLKYEPKPREDLTTEDATTYNLKDRILDPETVSSILGWLATQSGDEEDGS
jgi:alpha-beta hydrolase superfamily lysophospholipase